MLRKIRLTFAMICFVLITLLFLDFTGTLHGWFGWLAKIQFLPAVLALNVGVILFLVILTLVCGRIYCIIRKTKRFAIPERAVYFLKTKRTAGGTPPPQNIFDRLTPVFT